MTVEDHEVASAVPGNLALLYRRGFPCTRLTDPRAQQIERSTHIYTSTSARSQGRESVLNGPKGTECDLSGGHCGVCGHRGELFELPGRPGKYCLECSADVATAILLTTEIDSATLDGRSTNELVAEFSQISSRMLDRAQSAELGNI